MRSSSAREKANHIAQRLTPYLPPVEIKEPLTCSSHLLLWRVGEDFADKIAIIAPTEPRKIISITAKAVTPGDVSTRIEALGADGKYQLIVRPSSPSKIINAAVACVATFSDGTTHTFTVFALVR